MDTAAIVQWQNAALWQRMSWVRTPLAAPITTTTRSSSIEPNLPRPAPPSKSVERVQKDVSRPVAPAAGTLYSPNSGSRIFAGTSGWAYATWKPEFYPAKTPAKKFLEYYASRLTAVEVNYTFRALPTASMLQGWLASTGEHFRFGFKAPQRITHFNRLVNCEAEVARFLASLQPVAAARRLGPILFQLPPNFQADPSRLAAFLDIPELAAATAPRITFEFRHPSWFSEEVYAILRSKGVALCIAEGDELVSPEIQCAPDFACYRLRRSGGYSPDEITDFAQRFLALAGSRDVFIFFRHEDEPTGALNAVALLQQLPVRSS
jgi:uncharacterized protein YecE (DUF72 family)